MAVNGVVTNWHELTKAFEVFKADGTDSSGQDWIFRGVADSRWPLQSSLERAFLSFKSDLQSKNIADDRTLLEGGRADQLLAAEDGLVRWFKRRYHHHTDQLLHPSKLELLSLMQHYGAPTRLLDWTYSFYAAIFFAIERACAKEENDSCCVWAIDANWVRNRFKQRYPDLWKSVDSDKNLTRTRTFELVFRNRGAFVCPIRPNRLNDRLIIQQGLFLSPGDLSQPFEDNLAGLLNGGGPNTYFKKVLIRSTSPTRRKILQGLLPMNMTAASLFPGLEGFTRSLKSMLVFQNILRG